MLRFCLLATRPKEVIAMNDVFNTLLEIEGNDPEFARAYAAESARIEATADPDDERLADGELLSVGLAGDRVELTVKWTSRAGAAAVMVAPIATVVK
jgi:hypothetical protein